MNSQPKKSLTATKSFMNPEITRGKNPMMPTVIEEEENQLSNRKAASKFTEPHIKGGKKGGSSKKKENDINGSEQIAQQYSDNIKEISKFQDVEFNNDQATWHLPILSLLKSESMMSQDLHSEQRSRAESDA